MPTFHDYTNLTEHIHAPKELQARVLKKARVNAGRELYLRPRSKRSRGFLPKVAAAAVLAVLLPLSALAAANYLGLGDYLAARGMGNIVEAESLISTVPSQGQGDYCNDYACYQVQEVILDSESIYLAARVSPVSERYLLIPQGCDLSDSVESLLIDGLSGCTIEEYAATLGKEVITVSIGYFYGSDIHLDGALDFICNTDGSVSFYFSGPALTSNYYNEVATGETFTLNCMGIARASGADGAERTEFEITVSNNSTAESVAEYAVFDAAIAQETGLQMERISVEQTEIGTYFTFIYSGGDAQGYNFTLLDASGAELSPLPNLAGSGVIDQGDGTFSETVYCQRLDSLEGLQFVVRRFSDDELFGPYSIDW